MISDSEKNHSLNVLVYTLELIKRLIIEDYQNFSGFYIYGQYENKYVSFIQANELVFKIIYNGYYVIQTLSQKTYGELDPYEEFKNKFQLINENNETYSFNIRIKLCNNNLIPILNEAFEISKFNCKIIENISEIYVPLT